MSLAFALEKQVAISAVLRACSLTSAVFNKLVKNETLVKGDKSPVTVADYSAQAVINVILAQAFPSDPIVGEEDSADLRNDSDPTSATLRSRITELANEALALPLRDWEKAEWGIGPTHGQRTTSQLLDAIDRGNFSGARKGRMWTLDPIDGTKGFLRGEQYAVCLALIEDSEVKLGVMGCPNLPLKAGDEAGEKGCIFVAVEGQGSEQRPISSLQDATPIHIPTRPLSELRTLESVEAAHSSQSTTGRIAQALGITAAPVRMDSQAKYCSLARGDGDIYLRMPTGVGYVEKIWDHAGGSLLVTEAGGVVSDSRGQPLDFGLGRTLGENFGVIASGKDVHPSVLEAVRKARAEESQKL
ncbi:3(2),5-bisphosphate nucleotidase HAL2 [Exidia glandulosa HHB12029]|uniref:3'(2'),5'-bisphosphate nucleotidase n=1 Tax=Exidia glandulosa HHB12029 TaxID=1314781 RepID=A0A165CX37_EXIGL|nr:3(2),5-bisphosphate nucleotidase HAL2 [Exidia glandulosa HHB12029]